MKGNEEKEGYLGMLDQKYLKIEFKNDKPQWVLNECFSNYNQYYHYNVSLIFLENKLFDWQLQVSFVWRQKVLQMIGQTQKIDERERERERERDRESVCVYMCLPNWGNVYDYTIKSC